MAAQRTVYVQFLKKEMRNPMNMEIPHAYRNRGCLLKCRLPGQRTEIDKTAIIINIYHLYYKL